MIFSKSFGYAIRSILYVVSVQSKQQWVQLNDIAAKLKIPRHFLAKVMKRLVKEGVLDSQRGPAGGFGINENTLRTPVVRVLEVTGEAITFNTCVLGLNRCNSTNPCPMHHRAQQLRDDWVRLLSSTTIGDLFGKTEHELVKSFTTF
jgi:Rrf2 family iron-sulfur cluster assembly transcriptional regulator